MAKKKKMSMLASTDGLTHEHALSRAQMRGVCQRMEWMTNDMVGSLMQAIEMLGLPERQEQAAKDKIKAETWNKFRDTAQIFAEYLTKDPCKGENCGWYGCPECVIHELHTPPVL